MCVCVCVWVSRSYIKNVYRGFCMCFYAQIKDDRQTVTQIRGKKGWRNEVRQEFIGNDGWQNKSRATAPIWALSRWHCFWELVLPKENHMFCVSFQSVRLCVCLCVNFILYLFSRHSPVEIQTSSRPVDLTSGRDVIEVWPLQQHRGQCIHAGGDTERINALIILKEQEQEDRQSCFRPCLHKQKCKAVLCRREMYNVWPRFYRINGWRCTVEGGFG